MLPPLREVETQELTADAASITFSSINTKVPSGSRHLVVLISGLKDAGGEHDVQIQFNGDTGSNYNLQLLDGASTTASASRLTGTAVPVAGVLTGAADRWGGGTILIPHYANALNHKAALFLGGDAENRVRTTAIRWANTDAITSLLLKLAANNFKAGTRVILCVVDERYLIEEEIKSADGADFAFSVLPAVDGDLVAIGYLRTDRASSQDGIGWTANGDTTNANYARQSVEGTNTTAAAATGSDRRITDSGLPGDQCTANAFGAVILAISQFNRGDDDPHLTASCGFHSTSTLNSHVFAASCRWGNVAAMTSVTFFPYNSSNWKDGSMMSLYLVPRRLVQRITLTAKATTVTFSKIPANVEALILRVYARDDGAATVSTVEVEFNADTVAANYDMQRLFGTGTTLTVTNSAANPEVGLAPSDNEGADEWGGGDIWVPVPLKTDRHKFCWAITGSSDLYVTINATRWENNAAITSVIVSNNNGDYLAGSVFELFAVYANGQDVSDRTRLTKTMATT